MSGDAMPRLPIVVFAALALVQTTWAQGPAPDSMLCRAQLELLLDGKKLTEEEAALFEAQCRCLEAQEAGDGETIASCAQEG